MQSVAKRVLETEDDGRGSPPAMSKMAFQLRLDDDQLDENDMERILSRPVLTRRKVDLFEAPEFVKRLSGYQEADVGDEVVFSGQYRAFPKPTVKWFKDEEEISETKRHRLDSSSEFEGIVRLIIQDVIKRDEGAYKCKVENQEGVASTTGYLSVSGKSYDRGSSGLQTKKMAQDRVSTPPYLRPIAEQKSVEEREEREYRCLPPSPLQEFMDKIRHCAKSMQGPIVYGNLEGLFYTDDDVIRDFEDDADVFDEDQSSSTPPDSPVEDHTRDGETLLQEDNIDDRKRPSPGQSVKVVDVFISPTFDLTAASPQVETQASYVEESASDTEGQCCNADEGKALNNNDSTGREQRDNLINRRTKLALQRSLAVEIPELDAVRPDQPPPSLKIEIGKSSLQREETSEQLVAAAKSSESSEEVIIDLVFQYIKSPWIQLFSGVILSATSVSLAADIPPIYVIVVVVVVSILCFQILERQERAGKRGD